MKLRQVKRILGAALGNPESISDDSSRVYPVAVAVGQVDFCFMVTKILPRLILKIFVFLSIIIPLGAHYLHY